MTLPPASPPPWARARSTVAASARSAPVVILRLVAAPSTSNGCSARPLERLRLVGRPAPGRVRRIQRRAQPSVAEHLRRERPPQTRPLHGFPDHRLRAAGAAGALEGIRRRAPRAARRRRASPSARSSRSRSCAARHGLAASCTSTQSSAAARTASAARALRTDWLRCAPPVTVENRAACRAPRRCATCSNPPSSGASATTMCAQRGSARNGASAHSSTVRPASGAYCLVQLATEAGT